MPNANTYRSDGTLATKYVPPDKDDEKIASAVDRSRLSSTAGTGLGSKGKSLTGAPKQEPGEAPQAYGDRLRKWRETQMQQRALGGK
jgi:hypothetical protein